MNQAQRINGYAVPEWQSLESIPRDGRTVEILDSNGDVFLAKVVGGRLVVDSDSEYLVQPTGWRLLIWP